MTEGVGVGKLVVWAERWREEEGPAQQHLSDHKPFGTGYHLMQPSLSLNDKILLTPVVHLEHGPTLLTTNPN